MGRTCSTYEGEVRTGFLWGNIKRKPRKGICRRWKCNSGKDFKVIFRDILDWFQVALVRETLQAVVTTVMNSQFSENVSKFCRI
jgi:hypothetical protein